MMTGNDSFDYFENPWSPFYPVSSTPMIQLVPNETDSVLDFMLATAQPFKQLLGRRALTQIPSYLLDEIDDDDAVGITTLNTVIRHSADDSFLVLNNPARIMQSLTIFALASLLNLRDVLIFFSDRESFGKFHKYMCERIRPWTPMVTHTCDACFTHSYNYQSSFMHIVMVINDNSQSWPMPFTKSLQSDMRQIIRRDQSPNCLITPVVILFNTRSAIASTIFMRFAMARITKIFVTDQHRADATCFMGIADSLACVKASNGKKFRIMETFHKTIILDGEATKRSIALPIRVSFEVDGDDSNDENHLS
jgi:hypothetical protein